MKITWKARAGVTGVSPVVLSDFAPARGAGSKVCLFVDPSFQQILQVAAYPDADEVEIFGRKNISTSYRFAVAYEFATFEACQIWRHDIGGLMTSEGILSVTFPKGGTRNLTGGWESIAPGPGGASTVVQFSFLGGAFTTQSITGL